MPAHSAEAFVQNAIDDKTSRFSRALCSRWTDFLLNPLEYNECFEQILYGAALTANEPAIKWSLAMISEAPLSSCCGYDIFLYLGIAIGMLPQGRVIQYTSLVLNCITNDLSVTDPSEVLYGFCQGLSYTGDCRLRYALAGYVRSTVSQLSESPTWADGDFTHESFEQIVREGCSENLAHCEYTRDLETCARLIQQDRDLDNACDLEVLAKSGLLNSFSTLTFRKMNVLAGTGETLLQVAYRLDNMPGGWFLIEHILDLDCDETNSIASFERHSKDVGDEYAALMLTLLDVVSSDSATSQQRDSALHLAHRMLDEEKQAVVLYLYRHPSLIHRLVKHLATLEILELRTGGDCRSSYLKFAEALMVRRSLPDDQLAETAMKEAEGQLRRVSLDSAYFDSCWSNGRTLLSIREDKVLGLKLPKANEQGALWKEAAANDALRMLDERQGLGLESRWPRTIGMITIDPRMTRSVSAPIKLEQGDMDGLLYEVPIADDEDLELRDLAYFRYPHLIKDLPTLRRSSRVFLSDWARLASRIGLLNTIPADLYHNASDSGRRYHWNPEQLGVHRGGTSGAGRLERPREAIAYMNAGELGLRDTKSFQTISMYAKELERERQKFTVGTTDKAAALMSGLGDMLFAWVLSVAEWYRLNNRLTDVKCLETTLRWGISAFFESYTRRKSEYTKRLLLELVDWQVLAEQISYYFSGAYVTDLRENRVRQGIYPDGRCTVQKPSTEHWDDSLGWSEDGVHVDCGPRNGPFPVTSLIGGLHCITAIAITLGSVNQQR
ncbi:hypothetical protein N7471_010453 [Penicillium samsonianum]|uniref:uncharacterized protein n=1 Tax=Penicillium samsonianum TaxID=1882272 RepID=UPI002548193E|nr:uncharacterized protein N7471_010453 [Penicillium samsonianum]KAJ6125960.1 hypothetical protein N7471_010453 [Penicillium samsonianum]